MTDNEAQPKELPETAEERAVGYPESIWLKHSGLSGATIAPSLLLKAQITPKEGYSEYIRKDLIPTAAHYAKAREHQELSRPKDDGAELSKEFFLDIVKEWKFFWMDQKQNSQADYENYHRRAFGIDANMQHDLAKRLLTKLDEFLKGKK